MAETDPNRWRDSLALSADTHIGVARIGATVTVAIQSGPLTTTTIELSRDQARAVSRLLLDASELREEDN